MSKSEAKERLRDGGFTWEVFRRLLEAVHTVLGGAAGRKPSRVNKRMSRAAAFNIHWRALQGKSGPVPRFHLGAINLLREFGETKRRRSVFDPPVVTHEPLINITKETDAT